MRRVCSPSSSSETSNEAMNVRYDVTTEDDECHVPNAESRTYSRSSYQVGGGRPPDVVEEVVRQEYNISTNDQQIPLGRVTSNIAIMETNL